ncbi:MAG TPA: DNA gyrase subunit A [Vitreimonas sp.]|nr:DNA gyrase subunit A [Vitreimonas sp.]
MADDHKENDIEVTTEDLDETPETETEEAETPEVEESESEETSEESEASSEEGVPGQTQPPGESDEAQKAALIGTIEDSKFGKIKYISIVNEMEKSYLDYAMSVIVSRALPDVRDGLKPVHRRILYSMYRAGIHHTSSYKKSARIVGDVLGRYHPHGDSPVYMALVRLAQDFSMRYQLIDGQGNFGSIDGDSPAAMRYTEARLAKISQELLIDLNKNTVPMVDNFDGSLQEPTVLPGRLPNLLLMGSEGIAVGMATKIPPHNLTEVCKAIIATIKAGKATKADPIALANKEPGPTNSNDLPNTPENPTKEKVGKAQPSAVADESLTSQIDAVLATDARIIAGEFTTEISFDEIMTHVKGPDFPTGGIIYDFKAIQEGYQTGKGKIVVRGKASIEEGKKGFQIIVTELPYQVNKARLIMKIADLVRDKKIMGIRDLNDDSDRKGMQITIDLKRDAMPKVVLNKLFKFTELQTSFALNMVALNSDGTPQLMNIKQVLREYISHRQLVIVRRSQYELAEARDRAHILEGLLIALNNLDDVIETIRRSADTDTARQALITKFGLSEVQATAILDMQLKRLAALERQKIEDEYKTIKEAITKLLTLLGNPDSILAVIAAETEELIALYGDDRKTKLIKGKVGEFSEEDLVPNEAAVITLTETGYIKRLSPTAFRSQSRGGKGSSGVKMKEEDTVRSLLTANTHDTLLLFTNLGRVFKLRAFDLPDTSRQAKGTAVVNLVNLKGDESVQAMLVLDEEADKDKYITLATRDGLVKKTAVKLYENIRQNGIVAITLNDGDQLVWGKLTSGSDHVMLITYQGKSIRFTEEEVKASNRDTKGVKGITLGKDDYVVGVEAFDPADEAIVDKKASTFKQMLVVTENGLGKRTELTEYPLQKRSGMGVKVAEITTRTGKVASARMVTHEHEEVVITTTDGQTIKLPITKGSIPVLTRPTQGVILMRMKAGSKVAAVALTYKEDPTQPINAEAAANEAEAAA